MKLNLPTFVFASAIAAATSVIADNRNLRSRTLHDDIIIQVHNQNGGEETIKISSSNNKQVQEISFIWEFCFSCDPNAGFECAATENTIHIEWLDEYGREIDEVFIEEGCEELICREIETKREVDGVKVDILGSHDLMLINYARLKKNGGFQKWWGTSSDDEAYCIANNSDDLEKMTSDDCNGDNVYDGTCYEGLVFDDENKWW